MKLLELIEDFNELHLKNLMLPSYPSTFITDDIYQVLILRELSFTKEGPEYFSKGHIFYNGKIYLFNPIDQSVVHLVHSFEQLYKETAFLFSNNKIVESYIEEVDNLEDSLFERNPPVHFMDTWFDLKKDLARIERYYLKSLGAMKDFYKYFLPQSDFPDSEFKDLNETINLEASTIGSQLLRLDGLHHYFLSVKNDRLNKNLYFLTVISAIFLPLNLIVGFFGMNTDGLPFRGNTHGTLYVLSLLLGSLFISVAGLKIVRLIDEYILKQIFKKYNVYDQLTKNIEKILK